MVSLNGSHLRCGVMGKKGKELYSTMPCTSTQGAAQSAGCFQPFQSRPHILVEPLSLTHAWHENHSLSRCPCVGELATSGFANWVLNCQTEGRGGLSPC